MIGQNFINVIYKLWLGFEEDVGDTVANTSNKIIGICTPKTEPSEGTTVKRDGHITPSALMNSTHDLVYCDLVERQQVGDAYMPLFKEVEST